MSPRVVSLLLILAVFKAGCNKNTKYVKGDDSVASLCDLESLLALHSDDGDVAGSSVDDRDLMVVQKLGGAAAAEAVKNLERKPKAVLRGIKRELAGDGAHREILSDVVVDVDLGSDASALSVADDCELILLEHLSPGAFADPFQLHRLQQQNAVKFANIYGDADLERPAKRSFSSIVELRQRLVPAKADKVEVLYRSEVALPLHSRYPPTSPASHYVMNLTLPHVLVSCERGSGAVAGNADSSKVRLCLYGKMSEAALTRAPSQLLQWRIPSGYPSHYFWTEKLTMFAGLAGVASIFMSFRIYAKHHGYGHHCMTGRFEPSWSLLLFMPEAPGVAYRRLERHGKHFVESCEPRQFVRNVVKTLLTDITDERDKTDVTRNADSWKTSGHLRAWIYIGELERLRKRRLIKQCTRCLGRSAVRQRGMEIRIA